MLTIYSAFTMVNEFIFVRKISLHASFTYNYPSCIAITFSHSSLVVVHFMMFISCLDKVCLNTDLAFVSAINSYFYFLVNLDEDNILLI